MDRPSDAAASTHGVLRLLGQGPRRVRACLIAPCCVGLVGVFLPAIAFGRSPSVEAPERRPLLVDADPELRTPLSKRFGLDAATALLGLDDERAIRRLGELDGAPALQELVRLAEAPSSLSDRALLLLTRALARPSTEPLRIRALYSIAARGVADASSSRQTPLGKLAREEAAMALAGSGSKEAQVLLARMVKRGHADGELAANALLLHPPSDLTPLLASPGAPNPMFVELLEKLGDQRGFAALRAMVRRGSPEVQARAALALTRLGHLETVPLAKHWLKAPPRRAWRDAATEILLQTHDPEGAGAWEQMFDEDRERAIELAFAYPQPSLVEPIAKLLEKNDEPRLLGVLGHTGGKLALLLLEKALGTPRASTAAYALARCPDASATAVLERALDTDGAPARVVLAAAVVRSVLRDESISGLEAKLGLLKASKHRDDIFIAVWGLSALNEAYAIAQLRSPSKLALGASVVTAMVHSASYTERAAEALASETDPERRALLGVALLHEKSRDRVPSHDLLTWTRNNGPVASLARMALSERDDPRFEALVSEWLASPAALTRIASALGLSRHRSPSSTSKLAMAYEFEADADVRVSLIMALGRREAAPSRTRALSRAVLLDPDARVQAMAKLALLGQVSRLVPSGEEVLWLEVPDGPVPESVVLAMASGLAFPVPLSGQRLLPILGIGSADVRVRLAQFAERNDDATTQGEQLEQEEKDDTRRGRSP